MKHICIKTPARHRVESKKMSESRILKLLEKKIERRKKKENKRNENVKSFDASGTHCKGI